jgi:hypothetical protein
MFSGRSGLRDRPALLTLVSLGASPYLARVHMAPRPFTLAQHYLRNLGAVPLLYVVVIAGCVSRPQSQRAATPSSEEMVKAVVLDVLIGDVSSWHPEASVVCIGEGQLRPTHPQGPLEVLRDADPQLFPMIRSPGVALVPYAACAEDTDTGWMRHADSRRKAIQVVISSPRTIGTASLEIIADYHIASRSAAGTSYILHRVDDRWIVTEQVARWRS